jgi:hypothetical protein
VWFTWLEWHQSALLNGGQKEAMGNVQLLETWPKRLFEVIGTFSLVARIFWAKNQRKKQVKP